MGSKSTQTISDFKDLRAAPQIVDFFSQAGIGGGQRGQFGQQVLNSMMKSLKGLSGGGGGGYGGGGGGFGGGGGGGGFNFKVLLDKLKFEDPHIQSGLRRGLRGIRAGTEDELAGLGDEAARAGVSGGRKLSALAQVSRQGSQREAESRQDVELGFMERKEGRDEMIGQLNAALDQARIGAEGQLRSAQAQAGGMVGAARAGAAPGMARVGLERQMAPLQFMQAFSPYGMNFGSMTPTTTTTKQSGGFGSILGGIIGTGASMFGAGGMFGKGGRFGG